MHIQYCLPSINVASSGFTLKKRNFSDGSTSVSDCWRSQKWNFTTSFSLAASRWIFSWWRRCQSPCFFFPSLICCAASFILAFSVSKRALLDRDAVGKTFSLSRVLFSTKSSNAIRFQSFFSLVIIFSRANERFFSVSRGLARVQWSYPLGEITLHSMMGPRSVRAGGRGGMAYRKMIDGTRWKEIAF